MTRRRKFFWIGLISLAALALLVAVAPWFANIGPVRRLAELEIGKVFGHAVFVAEVEASWGGGVHARGVRIKNSDSSFSEPTILAIEDVHLDMPLRSIIWGGAKSTNVRIEGMRVLIEEFGGGRINLSGLVPRLFPRRDAPADAKPGPPLVLSLRNCTIEVRHMARPAGDPVVDPFLADPVIRATDEGAVSVVLDSFDLDVRLAADGSTLSYDGGIKIDGRGGRLTAEFAPGRTDVSASDLDLSVFGRFLGRELGGFLDLTLADVDGKLEIAGSVRALRCSAPVLDEERVEFRLTVAGGRVESMRVHNAAGDVRLNASGGRKKFHVEGAAPRAFLARALGRRETIGVIEFNIEGHMRRRVLHTRGTVRSRDGPRGTVTARLDVDFGLDDRKLHVHDLVLDAEGTVVKAKGTLTLGDSTTCDLTGSADADLGLLFEAFGPYLGLDALSRLEGRADFPNAHVVIGSERTRLELRSGRIDNLRIRLGDAEIHAPHAELDIDVTLTDGGNVLDVARCDVFGCELTGKIVGLKQKLPDDARVKGTIHLTPFLARLLKLGDMELGGRLVIDLSMHRHELGLAIDGRIVAHELRLNRFHSKRLVLNVARGGYTRDREWFGDATLIGEHLRARIRLMRFDAKNRNLRGEIALEEASLADLAELIDLPSDIEVAGVIKPVVGVTWDAKTWHGHVVLGRTALTVRRGDLGIRAEPVRFHGRVRHGANGTRLFGAELNIGDIKIVPDVSLSSNGEWSADLELKSMAHALRRCVPALENIELGGRLVIDAKLRNGRVFGTLSGTGVAMTIDDRRIEVGRITIDADEDGAFELRSGDASLKGTARLGRTLDLELDGGGRMPALEAWLPNGFQIEDLRCRIPLRGSGGAAMVKGRFRASRARIGDIRLFEVDLHGDLHAPDASDLLHTVKGTLSAKADAATFSGLSLKGLELTLRERASKSKLRGLKYVATVTAREFAMDGVKAKGLALRDITGLLADFDFGPRSFAALGPITFDEVSAAGMRFTKGRGRVAWWKRRLDVLSLEARGERGELKLTPARAGARTNPVNWIDLSRKLPEYRFDIALEGIAINKDLGKALSLAIPLLVTAKERKRRIRGTLDISVNGRGKGFCLDTIEDTLFARGKIVMHDAEFEGSAALSLSGFQIGAAFDGRSYRFKQISVEPTFRDGLLRITPKQTLIGGLFQIQIEGTASLRGRLDYTVYASYFRLPIKVRGTVDNPDVAVLGFIR